MPDGRSIVAAPESAGGRAPRPAAALLEYVTTHPLDEDYAVAARLPRSERDRRLPVAALVLVLAGLLIAVSVVRTVTAQDGVRTGRADLLNQIDARKEAVAARQVEAQALGTRVAGLTALSLTLALREQSASDELAALGVATGAAPVTGGGVRVVVDDADGATTERLRVQDKDLQKLVNALWEAGALAISVNGIRLSALSAIRVAGDAITVDYRSLRAPYTVLAIGDPNTLQTGFVESTHGQAWLTLRNTLGLRFEITPADSLSLPVARRLGLRLATPVEDAS